MPYNETLASRIRSVLAGRPEIVEKKMFGGIGFLWNGHLLIGLRKETLVVRLGPDEAEYALREPHVTVFDITGKPMRGWVQVAAPGLQDEESVRDWIERATRFVETLPAKTS